MTGGIPGDGADVVLSALRWWTDAGVDLLVDEAPRDWLAPPRRATPDAAAAASAPVAALADRLPETLPDTLTTLDAWIADPANLPALGPRRIAATGTSASGLMVVADVPEREDREALMEGRPGRLLDAMLAAIGRDRAAVLLVPFAPARPPAGRIDRALGIELARLARRRIALARPRCVLLLGDAVTTGLLDTGFAAARGRLHDLNHGDGTVGAVATFHPRFLLDHPACKADAWADLRLVLEEFGQ